jgi:BASS family bile acid:Na+ symporter
MLASLLRIVIPLFAVTSMLSVGLGTSARQIVGPLRDLRGVITAVAANVVLMPLLAAGVAFLFALDRSTATGLVLVATAAGAPFLIKLAQFAKADVAFAASILVLLLVVTIVTMPIVVPLLGPDGSASAVSIARPLLLTMLLPLGLALGLGTLRPTWAARLRRPAGTASSLSLVALVLLTVVVNLDVVRRSFSNGALPAATLVIVGAFAIGFVLGAFDPAERIILGFAAAYRNFAAAIVVATESFHDRDVLVMVVVASIVSLVLLPPAAWAFGRRRGRKGEPRPHAVPETTFPRLHR